MGICLIDGAVNLNEPELEIETRGTETMQVLVGICSHFGWLVALVNLVSLPPWSISFRSRELVIALVGGTLQYSRRLSHLCR